MASIYVRWIKQGKLTLEEVPDRWRAAVEEKLKEAG